ncbi:MAG: MFS transporter [Sphingomonadales bacterium]|nr:MAG: MFS transporter [Sphingomonadales bacterium]
MRLGQFVLASAAGADRGRRGRGGAAALGRIADRRQLSAAPPDSGDERLYRGIEHRREAAVSDVPDAGLWRYLLAHRAVFAPLMTAMILYAILAYGLLGWVPAFFIRSYGMSASEVGFQYGVVLLIFGGGGGLAGAAVAARIGRRFGSPELIVCAAAAALTGPLMVLAFAAPTPGIALAWLAPALLTYTVPSGLAIAALQSAVPPQNRGMAAALYYLLIGLLGMTLGPLSVAILTDNVFGTGGLRWSLASVALVCAAMAALLFLKAARPHLALSK